LIKLVQDLLTVEKLKSGRSELRLSQFNISETFDRALESVAEMSKEHQITIDVPKVDIAIEADEDKITQVVVNLLSNAIKYSPSGGTVSVAAHNSQDWLEVRVTDNGCGVPVAAQKRIFESFQQVDAKTDEKKGGTGLGLAICKAIVEQHAGSIGVDSEGAQGSTFWFRIPLLSTVRAQAVPAASGEVTSD
jgi:signal transduction histidine kinase